MNFAHLWNTYSYKSVTNCEASILLGSTPLYHLGDKDSIISRNVLIADTTGYTEAKAWSECNNPLSLDNTNQK